MRQVHVSIKFIRRKAHASEYPSACLHVKEDMKTCTCLCNGKAAYLGTVGGRMFPFTCLVS